jgi:hypothetical protein
MQAWLSFVFIDDSTALSNPFCFIDFAGEGSWRIFFWSGIQEDHSW